MNPHDMLHFLVDLAAHDPAGHAARLVVLDLYAGVQGLGPSRRRVRR